MGAEKHTVDLNKPLVFQVGHLGEAYQTWVHQPITTKQSPRFFENDFLEFFTLTAWWVIPIVWLPVVGYLQIMSINRGLPLIKVAASMLMGFFVWTLLEYCLHRFLFHMKTSSFWGNTLHYLLHGCHHKHPMDGYRLVFPPVAAAIICVPLWLLSQILIPYRVLPAGFSGALLGYVTYDVTHYHVHHGNSFNKTIKKLKKNHLNHHFKFQMTGFGVTSGLWDWVFGTLPSIKVT